MREIKNKVSQLETQSSTLRTDLQTKENLLNRTVGERERAYVQLATIYLPELTSQAVTKTLAEIKEQIETVYQDKLAQEQQLEERISALQAAQDKAHSGLAAVNEQLEGTNNQLQDLNLLLAEELKKSTAYQSLVDEAQALREKLAQERQQTERLNHLAAVTLPEYRNHKIFQYLLTRLNDDTLKGALDRFVAAVINFPEVLRRYEILQSLSETGAQRLSVTQKELANLESQIKDYEAGVSTKIGRTTVVTAVTELTQKRTELSTEIESIDRDHAHASQKYQELQTTQGEHYDRALATMAAYLKEETITDLFAKAAETATPEDDRLVKLIEQSDAKIATTQNEIKDLKVELKPIDEQLQKLRRLENEYRRRDFDSSESYFDNSFNLDQLLTGYLLGEMIERDIFHKIGSHHHVREDSYGSYNHNPGSSSHNSNNWGSSSHHTVSSWSGGGGHHTVGGWGKR